MKLESFGGNFPIKPGSSAERVSPKPRTNGMPAVRQQSVPGPAISDELVELISLGLAVAPLDPLDTLPGRQHYTLADYGADTAAWAGYIADRRKQQKVSVENIRAEGAHALVETYRSQMLELQKRIVGNNAHLAAIFEMHYGLRDLFAVLGDIAGGKTSEPELIQRADSAMVRLSEMSSVLLYHPTEGQQASNMVGNFQASLLEKAQGMRVVGFGGGHR